MDREYRGKKWRTEVIEDVEGGSVAIQLSVFSEGEWIPAARLVFWDAQPIWLVESVVQEVPVVVLEELIAEGRVLVPSRLKTRRKIAGGASAAGITSGFAESGGAGIPGRSRDPGDSGSPGDS